MPIRVLDPEVPDEQPPPVRVAGGAADQLAVFGSERREAFVFLWRGYLAVARGQPADESLYEIVVGRLLHVDAQTWLGRAGPS